VPVRSEVAHRAFQQDVAGAVLAGGPSRRMGRDKATLPLGGSLLGRLAVEAVAAVADPVALVAPAGHPANGLLAAGAGAPGGGSGGLKSEAGTPVVGGNLEPSGSPPVDQAPARLLTVADPGRGPLAALAAALRALPAEYLVVVAGDHPGLRVELLRRLVAMRAQAPALACRRGGRVEPMVAIYRREPALAAAEARLAGRDHSLRGLLADLGARLLDEAEWRPFDPDGRSFVDLDDPAALAAWLRGRR
jgi:molybdopterin-guanine dinucleotide biosynthesis protein A